MKSNMACVRTCFPPADLVAVGEEKAVFHRYPEPNRYSTVVQSSCWSLDHSQKNAEPQLWLHNWLLLQLQPYAIFVIFVASCANQLWEFGKPDMNSPQLEKHCFAAYQRS